MSTYSLLPGCWEHYLKANANRNLGQYKLQLTHPNGNLELTWAVDLPECWTITFLRDGSYLVSTNAPNTMYMLLIHAPTQPDDFEAKEFIAQRSLTSDKDGLIEIRVTLPCLMLHVG